MKHSFTTAAVLFLSISILAQSPQMLSYQSVIRNSSGDLVSSQAVGLRITILQGSSTGTVVYQETYDPSPITNVNGLLSIKIGSGSPLSGIFSDIDWSAGPYFLKTETDPTGGNSYSIEGTSQLLSVPYALHSETAGNVFSGNYEDLTNQPVLFDGDWASLTGIPSFADVAFSGSYSDLLDTPAILPDLWSVSGSDIYFNTGRVGVGTNNPQTSLHVYGSPVTSRGQLSLSSPAGEDIFLSFYEYGNFKSYLWYNVTDEDLRLQNYTAGDLNLQPYGGRVGIGTNTPRTTLEVNGQIQITGGTPAAGQVLTSDANGLATWEPPATPAVVCFEVKRDAIYDWDGNGVVRQIDFSSNSTVWRNDGNDFNLSTSTFTAPENGIYTFHGVIYFQGIAAGNLVYAFLRIGGGTKNYEGPLRHANGSFEGVEVSMTLYLPAGETVQLWGYVNDTSPPAQVYGNTAAYGFTYFTGAKVN